MKHIILIFTIILSTNLSSQTHLSYYFGDINQSQETGIWVGLLCGLLFSAVFLYLRFNFLTNKMINSFE